MKLLATKIIAEKVNKIVKADKVGEFKAAIDHISNYFLNPSHWGSTKITQVKTTPPLYLYKLDLNTRIVFTQETANNGEVYIVLLDIIEKDSPRLDITKFIDIPPIS
jgi:hypothetical protein